MKLYSTALFFVAVLQASTLSLAQELVQKVKGKVTDHASGIPLENASVIVSNINKTVNAQTDKNGEFQMEIPIGRYKITATITGYAAADQELLVISGREAVVNFALTEKAQLLREVEVTSTSIEENVPGARSLTIEKTLRVPANFFDPVRVATAYPGVIAANDQNNSIIVRGNSPNGLLWRLNGLDIVNPNHLANAGTLSDKPALNGGGVNILSAQMLDRTNFYMGAFPSRYGNALAGVIDMKLREGNKNKFQYTAQASLIGMDVAAEGPIGKKQNTSFVANYRYSTVGLLSKLGVNFGDEAIMFQDLSFFIDKDLNKGGKLSLFGIYGNSMNKFKHKPLADWAEDKDRYDIDYSSNTLATGLNFSKPVFRSGKFSVGLAYSSSSQERNQQISPETPSGAYIEDEKYNFDRSIVSGLLKLEGKAGQNSNWELGVMTNVQNNNLDFNSIIGANGTAIYGGRAAGAVDGLLIQPFVNWDLTLSKIFSVQAGVHYLNFTYNNTSQIEPRIQLSVKPSETTNLDLSYNLVSQIQQTEVYVSYLNTKVDLTKAHHFNVAFRKQFNGGLNFKAGTFYQQLFDVPVPNINSGYSSFSTINLIEGFSFPSLVNAGKGKNYGIDATVEKDFFGNQYFMVGGSFYQSTYTDNAGIEHNTKFNGNYTFSSVYGKEWTKLSRNRTISLNTRLLYLGGLRESTISVGQSESYGFSVYDTSKPYNQKLNDYFRLDLRLSFRKNKPKYTRTFAIDIQNLTSQQNESYHYYDFTQQKIVTKFQLGIIPILVYRIDF